MTWPEFPWPQDLDPAASALVQAAALFGGTFASEDLTCVTAGLLLRSGQIGVVAGLAGCLFGVFVGDLGLWLLGRLVGRRVLHWPWLARRLPADRLHDAEQWFARRGGPALLAARFLPGSRLPLYVAAGALGQRLRDFAPWTFLAALLWVPLVVLVVAGFGEVVVGPLSRFFGGGWLAPLAAAGLAMLLLRLTVRAATARGRAMLVASVSRLWRWEFWPGWLFYAPVVPWLGWLSLRYRGVTTWTAANPGIPHGGVVGESKYAILVQLPERCVVPTIFVPPGDHGRQMRALRRMLDGKGWSFPLILKPDASQRGAGVKRTRDLVDVEKYLQSQSAALVVQQYHPGPFEAGIFYYRLPGETAGYIFSITDKEFPQVVGDGRATLEELIWRHPRYRMQAHVFLTRHAADKDRVLADGEAFSLTVAGNHCQGTLFRDGSDLWTPQLEAAVDALARPFDGFFIGRFDVRYCDVEAFRRGEDLAVIELNGATSESTNLYDPSWSLLRAYRTLFRQWALLYRIGDLNRRRGHQPTPLPALLGLVFDYYRQRQVNLLAD